MLEIRWTPNTIVRCVTSTPYDEAIYFLVKIVAPGGRLMGYLVKESGEQLTGRMAQLDANEVLWLGAEPIVPQTLVVNL